MLRRNKGECKADAAWTDLSRDGGIVYYYYKYLVLLSRALHLVIGMNGGIPAIENWCGTSYVLLAAAQITQRVRDVDVDVDVESSSSTVHARVVKCGTFS